MDKHTCSLLLQYRWQTAALPHQSSWQTGWDQWLLPGVQDFSPLPGFDQSHTMIKTKTDTISICVI